MGAKDSKPSFISYEDAVKRVPESELRRIREAFKRCAGANGTALSLEAFVHEVLCDGVPYAVADWLYQACGGTKRGIAFRDLFCGIVVFTKGNLEEKIKFLWTLYVNNQTDNGTYIYKWDFARALHLENTSLPVTGAPRTAEILTGLFGPSEKVTFDQFRSWLLIHKDATVLSKWLLLDISNAGQELETPTFYQSLAGVTHLEERDIIELEKCFWSLRNSAPTGQLDAESLAPLLSPPLPRAAVAGAFLAFDENRDGHVDFKELCCGLSAACRGPRTERLKFCFKIFDLDRDGVLNKKELIDMVGILCTVANESLKNQSSRASTPSDGDGDEGTDKGFDPEVILVNLKEKLIIKPKDGRKPVFQLGPNSEGEEIVVAKEAEPEKVEDEGLIAKDMALTQEDFLIWSVETAETLVTPFLELIFEVCHIVLGLRPQCKHQERDIVLGWLRREVSRGYSVGQFWYLVAAEWWGAWLAWTAPGADACCRQPPARQIDEAIVCDESFTSNSTESMGSLLWRADTVSLGSAGSSSGVSSAAAQRTPRHPGPIDNRRLLAPNPLKVRTLTGEGGHLRRDLTLAQHRDFELLPDALWRALAHWYGGSDPLPRQVIRPPNSDVELELYPLHLKLLRHVPNTQRANSIVAAGGVSLYGSAALAGAPAPPERHLAYTAAFSRLATVKQVTEFICQALGLAREDVRLWSLGGSAVLLDDERPTLHELRLDERSRLLVEVRNPDLTWPEEIGALGGGGRGTERRETLTAPDLPGATGLHNLGNTCYMNAALQSVWNTGPLTRYFNSGMHLYEVNTTNPLGTKGTLALRYGELCKEVWSCAARSVAPLRVRWCVSRWARALAGGGQHDAQELLAWLLDALHEDLNRAPRAPPPRTPHRAPASQRDSDGRPDQVVATEAWEQHTSRNQSIVTDLFYGQLKSKVRCDACGRDSVRFDAFNMLSLPLPMESYVRKELRVILLDGSVPIKYGVRVNSEGTYYDLKKRLSELCGLPPESMLLVELNKSLIGRVMEDGAKVGAGGELYVLETPRPDPDSDDSEHEHEQEHEHEHGRCESATEADAGARAEVSVPRAANTSSLCMPALFCFKRSRSEILMSQSPPNTFYGKYNQSTYTENNIMEHRCNTLPKDLSEMKKIEKNSNSSPTLSVKSLNLKPSSPRLGKVKFGSSPSDMNRIYETKDTHAPIGRIQYLVAVHRKQSRSDAYFLPWQRSRAGVFGVPVLVPVRDGLSGRALYARVWAQVARLLSARPPPAPRPHHNHATDCDDSLGYEFPFTLRAVDGAGAWCALCAWPRQCRGCALPSDDEPLLYGCSPGAGGGARGHRRAGAGGAAGAAADAPDGSSPIARAKLSRQCSARLHDDDDSPSGGELRRLDLGVVRARCGVLLLAIDWDPTALHLRYQTTREKAFVEHSSVASCASEAARPVDLGSCLRAFTREERLDERYHCAACHAAQPATKKLQIWRLPPIMIIHLKRFQYVNNKWIKSQKVVNFPFEDFDPTAYLASVPQETILRHHELKNMAKRPSSMLVDVAGHISESDSENSECEAEQVTSFNIASSKDTSNVKAKMERKRKGSMEVRGRQRLESTSLVTTPITDDNLVDYHQHHLKSDQDPFDLKYRLYAVVSHSGQMSGGHYVAYARNPSGAWLCYNDSSCRELTPVRREPHPAPVPPIDPATAYLLFYERQGLDYEPYLPDTAGREPVVNDSDSLDPDENDLRKMCVIS